MPGSGEGTPRGRDRGDRSPVETAVVLQVGLYLLVATWAFGGNSPGARLALCAIGSAGAALAVGILAFHPAARRFASWLWPLALLNVLVVSSVFNLNVTPLNFAGETLYARTGGVSQLPGTADPRTSLLALWLFDGIYLSCLNLAMVVTRRTTLRRLLVFAGVNALVLAVFGTAQQLTGSTGLYFGAVEAPQPAFFASFVYHNHWGSYAILMTAVLLGLARHYAERAEYRDFWHSPAPTALLGAFLVAASIPLSTSRSTTLLVLLLIAAAFVAYTVRTIRRRSAVRRSPLPPLAIGLFAVALALAAGYKLAEPVIERRVAKTREQVAELARRGDFGARQQLYRDTWTMARERLAFGWGLGSYPRIFYTFNTQRRAIDGFPIVYLDAHSDWLQAVAEVGLVGTAAIGLLGIVPLLGTRRSTGGQSPFTAVLLLGCGLILAYAWVEFPFGNPAVVFCWWLCFFAALQYRRLSQPKPAAIDAPSA